MGPIPLLLVSTKQWSVAVEVVNNVSTLCSKEQKQGAEEKTEKMSSLLP